ncbi:MAG: methylated-DNA--[protein]-cysteine S-methyltransferase [Pseudomonadota bacterium]
MKDDGHTGHRVLGSNDTDAVTTIDKTMSLPPSLAFTYLESPVGPLLLAGDGAALHLVSFPEGSKARRPMPGWQREDRLFADSIDQLQRYFSGELKVFTLALHLSGTSFQNSVWNALSAIPFGRTMSYGELAHRLDRPNASRAVGAANGANPIPIILPCHRVIGADGSLTGFGGGLETKRYLLAHEQRKLGAAAEQLDLF